MQQESSPTAMRHDESISLVTYKNPWRLSPRQADGISFIQPCQPVRLQTVWGMPCSAQTMMKTKDSKNKHRYTASSNTADSM